MWSYFDYLYDCALERSRRGRISTMCAKLDELKGLSVEKILKKAGQENDPPVNLDKIIEVLGLYKEARDFSDIEKIENKGKISGLVLLMGDDVKIFFNSNDSLEQKRFTAAHEIGHCCLHGDSLKDDYIEFLHKDGFEDKHEKEASIFAINLLIPKKTLRIVYNQLIEPTVISLAEIFQVPENIMRYRLKEENLITNDV